MTKLTELKVGLFRPVGLYEFRKHEKKRSKNLSIVLFEELKKTNSQKTSYVGILTSYI